MKPLLNLFSVSCQLRAWRNARLADRQRQARAQEAVERVVDGTEPRLRLVPGYRKKLQQPVAVALDYIDALVESIPPVLEVNAASFIRDPQVNAFFASPQHLHTIFGQSPELQAFFRDQFNADAAYALLCTTEHEKTLLGTELNGNLIRREVLQTAVYFADHKIMSPATSESGVRRGLKQCIFDALTTHALRHIAGLKSQRRDLEDQRRILHARLRARQAQANGLTRLLASALADDTAGENIEQELAATERKLAGLPASLDVLGDYLHAVSQILADPEGFIALRPVSFRLSSMGIKVDGDSSQTAHRVQFAEIEIVNVLKRVVAIVRYPRSEMLEAPQGF